MAVAVSLLAVTVGCGSGTKPADQSSGSPTGHALPTPTGPGDCVAASDAGSLDGGVVAGVQWPTGTFALGAPVQVFICVGRFPGATVVLKPASSQVRISPASTALTETSTGVIPIQISTNAAGQTGLRLQVISPTGKVQVNRSGPKVVATSTGWHFEKDG